MGTVSVFLLSCGLLTLVPQEFFPPSLRPEIIVEMTLPEGSSIAATEKEAKQFAAFLDKQDGLIKDYSFYVGEGAPRFVLTTEPVLPASNYAQFVVVAADTESRKELAGRVKRNWPIMNRMCAVILSIFKRDRRRTIPLCYAYRGRI